MNYIHHIEQGGLVMILLLVLFGIGSIIMFWKFFSFSYLRYRSNSLCQECKKKILHHQDKHYIQQVIDESCSQLESGLNTVKIIASIAPLLGLLGTVIGIFVSFNSIATHGLGDPKYFANGISMALITTIAGLIVAVPHYVGYNYLIGMLDKLELQLSNELYSYVRENNA